MSCNKNVMYSISIYDEQNGNDDIFGYNTIMQNVKGWAECHQRIDKKKKIIIKKKEIHESVKILLFLKSYQLGLWQKMKERNFKQV